MKIVVARDIAVHASLWHVLHFSPAVIAELTFWQIAHLAAHARNDKGELAIPEIPSQGAKSMTMEEQLAAIAWLSKQLPMDPGGVAAASDQLKALFATKTGGKP